MPSSSPLVLRGQAYSVVIGPRPALAPVGSLRAETKNELRAALLDAIADQANRAALLRYAQERELLRSGRASNGNLVDAVLAATRGGLAAVVVSATTGERGGADKARVGLAPGPEDPAEALARLRGWRKLGSWRPAPKPFSEPPPAPTSSTSKMAARPAKDGPKDPDGSAAPTSAAAQAEARRNAAESGAPFCEICAGG